MSQEQLTAIECLEWTDPHYAAPPVGCPDVAEKLRMVKVNPVVMLILASAGVWIIAAWLVVWLVA